MGEDVDFFDGAVASAKLIKALEAFDEPPADPPALALILERRCGYDIMFGLFGLHGDYQELRRRTLTRVRALKKYAEKLESDNKLNANVHPYSLTIQDLFDNNIGFEERPRLALQLVSAIALLANLPLRADLKIFHGPPPLDDRVTRVVQAVAEYWSEIERRPFGGGLDRQLVPGEIVVKKGSSAGLVKDVLGVLGIRCEDAQLETHLGKVKTAL